MFNRKSMVIAAVAAVVALGSGASISTTGLIPNTNRLTFNKPVGLPGVVLPAGNYVFELAPPGTHRDIVRVTTPKGRTMYLGFTRVTPRPADLPKEQVVTFGETATGEPTPISVWYPIGMRDGHEFVYE